MKIEIRHEGPSDEDLLSLIGQRGSGLSLKQKKLCDYIVKNHKKIAFWTVDELSKNSGTSPATVVRTVKSLGFSSYREMMGKIQNYVIDDKIPLWWEIEKSLEKEKSDAHVLAWVAKDNIESITASINNQLLDAISSAAEILSIANKIYIVAVRSSRAVGIFLHSMLSQMMNNVLILNYGEDEMYDTLNDMGENDVVIVVSLGGPHYATTSIKAAEYGCSNSVKTIVVANSHLCPAVKYADILLCVEQTKDHYSISAAITAIEALVIETGAIRKEAAVLKMRKLENTLIEKNITL